MNADYVENYSNLTQLPPLKDGFVNETVQALDYVTIAFENSVGGHFDLFEDIHISQPIGLIDFVGGFNEFEAELFKTTLLQILYDMPQLIPGFQIEDLQKAEYYEHYRQTLFILDELKNIPQMEGHKFVFAHILAPHPPYVFTPSGDFSWTDNDRKGYPSNAKFISSHVLPVIEEIISTSTIPPVIIVQGDHGAYGNFITPQMRLSILNAYYVDQKTQEALYDTITPVNSFRIIFNNYFGTDYPLLEDISYFMHNSEEFTPENVVENTCLSE